MAYTMGSCTCAGLNFASTAAATTGGGTLSGTAGKVSSPSSTNIPLRQTIFSNSMSINRVLSIMPWFFRTKSRVLLPCTSQHLMSVLDMHLFMTQPPQHGPASAEVALLCKTETLQCINASNHPRAHKTTAGLKRAHRKRLRGRPPVSEVRVRVAERLRDDQPPNAPNLHSSQSELHARDQLGLAILNPQKVLVITLEGTTLGLHAASILQPAPGTCLTGPPMHALYKLTLVEGSIAPACAWNRLLHTDCSDESAASRHTRGGYLVAGFKNPSIVSYCEPCTATMLVSCT